MVGRRKFQLLIYCNGMFEKQVKEWNLLVILLLILVPWE